MMLTRTPTMFHRPKSQENVTLVEDKASADPVVQVDVVSVCGTSEDTFMRS